MRTEMANSEGEKVECKEKRALFLRV